MAAGGRFIRGALVALVVLVAPGHVVSQAQGPSVEFTTDEGTWMAVDVTRDGQTIVFDLLGDLFAVPMEGGTARPLLTGAAFESQPRVSPDGRSLVYVSDRDGSDNLWIAGVDGSSPRALTTVPRMLMASPAWSADGRTVYATVIDAFASRTADLWAFDVATGQGQKLVPNGSGPPAFLVSAPAPGPYGAYATADGQWLFYAAVTPRPYGSRAGASARLVRRSLATGRDEPMAVDVPVAMKPTVSLDGRWLVYGADSRGQTGLRVRNLQSGEERWLCYPFQRHELESRASRDVLPNIAFTPDATAVVAAYGGKLHRIDLATGRDAVVPFSARISLPVAPVPIVTRRVDQGPVRARLVPHVAWARDGRLAFSTLARLYVTDVAGGSPRRLTSSARPREFMPAWSPDGQWVAFVTWDAVTGGALWKVRARGGEAPIPVGEPGALWADPVWTPDGAAIVALRAALGSARLPFPGVVPQDAEIVVVPAGGGTSRAIGAAQGARHPHFGADAGRVFLASPDALVSIALDGSARRNDARLARPRGPAGIPGDSDARVSPDGRQVAVLSGERLFRMPMPAPAGSGEPPLLDAASAPDATRVTDDATLAVVWAADGTAIGWTQGASFRSVSASAPPGAARVTSLAVEVPRAIPPSGTVVLRGARVITMRGTEVLDNADVVVTGNRIAAVAGSGQATLPAGARVIDVAGATIIPGIIDVHAHWSYRRELIEPETPSAYANLAFGVTTVRDPQTFLDIFTYADLADLGEAPSPRIYSTGPGLFSERRLSSLDEARRLLTRYRDEYGTHLIKSYMVGTRQERQWVAQASRELGLIATTEGGADGKMDLTHAIDGYGGNEHALPNAPLYRDAIELFARTKTTYTPTLLVSFGAALPVYRMLALERPYDHPRLRQFFPLDELYQRTSTRLLWFPKEDYHDDLVAAGAAAIQTAGGRVALGGHGEMQGLQVHWEMRLMAGGGMKPHDVLRAATLSGAEALGLAQDLGSLEPGKLADLVVLDHDPLGDIRATSEVRLVMKNGVLYRGATLDTVWPAAVPLPAPWWRATPGRDGSPSVNEAAVDAAVNAERTRQMIPAVSVAVLRGDRIVLAKGYGLANVEHQVPASAETMFQSGSLGKMFTAAGVMALVEDGRLSLAASIREYLPDSPASWQPITLRHLLSHTSGIPDYTGDAMDYRRDYSEADLTKMAYALTLEFPAGLRWNYSNTNYVLLGVIVGKVTGRPYWEFLRTRIFDPAGMPTARVISEADIVPGRASGYVPSPDGWKHQSWVAPRLNTTADGSLLISVRDLAAWAKVVRARTVLTQASWDAMLAPVTLNSGRRHPYGFGWFVDALDGQVVYQHGGSWQGFRTQFTRYEGVDLTVVALTNLGAADPMMIATRVAEAVEPSLVRPAPAPIRDDRPALTEYVRRMLETVARGELKVTDFEFVRATVVPRMSTAYGRLLGRLGSLQSLDLLSEAEEGDDRKRTYRARYRDGVVAVVVKIGPGGRLTGLTMSPEGE